MSRQKLIEAIARLIEQSETTRRDRILKKPEDFLGKKMRKAFQAQSKAFFKFLPPDPLKEAEGEQAIFPGWKEAFRKAEESTRDLFTGPLDESIKISVVAGANNVIAQTGAALEFAIDDARAIAYAKKHAASQVSKVGKTTKNILNSIVTNGVEEGLSYGQIAKQIKDRYADFAVSWPQAHIQNRAHAIAIFETGDAYEHGSQMVAEELAAEGLEMEKKWLTVGDSKVRSSHAANQAQGWIPINQEFQSGHMRAPTDPGCRCTTLYRMKPE